MAEDTWLKCEREYFATTEATSLGVNERILNKVLKKYNELLQRALFGESEYVAEDLKLTIIRARGGESASE